MKDDGRRLGLGFWRRKMKKRRIRFCRICSGLGLVQLWQGLGFLDGMEGLGLWLRRMVEFKNFRR